MQWTTRLRTNAYASCQPDSPAGPDRRRFLGNVVKAAGGLLLGDLAGVTAATAQTRGAGGHRREIHRLGWPQPWNRSPRSQAMAAGQGWWPLNAAWIVVWSSEEMIGHVLQTQKLLGKRGIETDWKTLSPPGSRTRRSFRGIQIANTGALGVLALLANKVPMRAPQSIRRRRRTRRRYRSTRRSRAFPISRARRC